MRPKRGRNTPDEEFGDRYLGEDEIKCACGCDTIVEKDDAVHCEVCHKYFSEDCTIECEDEGWEICHDCLNKAVDALEENKRLKTEIKRLEVACRLAKNELLEITNDSYALAAIEQVLQEKPK